jgi:hypothetical protein
MMPLVADQGEDRGFLLSGKTQNNDNKTYATIIRNKTVGKKRRKKNEREEWYYCSYKLVMAENDAQHATRT